jgi:CheY-like chemotaxis protein
MAKQLPILTYQSVEGIVDDSNCAGIRYAFCGGVAPVRKKVLIVEDHQSLREMLARFIEISGYEVLQASTGLAALEAVAATQPDIILMDLGLPGMDGENVTEIIKSDPATRHIPVVVHTAFAGTARTTRALQAGAAEILQKPANLKILRDVLHKYTSDSRGRTQVRVS